MNTGTITEHTFTSTALEEDLRIYVYVPADYTPMVDYPVMIASDGKDYIQLGRVSSIMDNLIDDGEMDEAIFVAVPYKSVQDRRDKYLPTGTKHQAYLHFLAHELLPFIQSNYTISTEPQNVTLIGDSQAATVSLLGAVAYPEYFGNVIMHSPLVNEDVYNIIKQTTNVDTFRSYHAIGLEETTVRTTDHQIKDFLTPNRKLHQLMIERGFDTHYKELDGDHSWKTWQPDLKEAFIYNFT